MGNNSGKSAVDENVGKWEQLYENLCCDHVLNAAQFLDHFRSPHDQVTQNLFNQFFIDLVNTTDEAKSLFVEQCHRITLHLNDLQSSEQITFFFDLVANTSPVISSVELRRIIHVYHIFGMYQVSIKHSVSFFQTSTRHDDYVIRAIAESILCGRDCIDRQEVVEWIKCNCPKLSNGLCAWLDYKLLGNISQAIEGFIPFPTECSTMDLLLTSACLWYMCCILPACYTYMKNKFEDDTEDDQVFTWNLLYNSNQHGLSLNRFKHKVLDYNSPTVMLFQLSCGLVIALALDEKWTDSPEKYGGTYCQAIELSPTVSLIEAGSKMVYLKECGRAVPTGLLIGSDAKPKVEISTDLNTAEIYYKDLSGEQVDRMEVWGCGGVRALSSQQMLKTWEDKEVENRRKVKLPGQWNADKAILEMGGVRVEHSQR